MEQKALSLDEGKFRQLYEAACAVARNSYSPYSHFPVGAALLMEDGSIITGANIENRSFGLTNCAERSAVFTAMSAGHRSFVALVIVTPASDYPVGPCGACRQVLTEFAPAETPVWFGPSWDRMVRTTLGELYPYDSLHELASSL
ncbi:MAG: cytidine deaminase [Spirochaetaceae bacterium]|nr:cytidine deaminase [Spirochaetaceae bacterium]